MNGTTPLGVLVVSRWYPSVDDGVAGRFVADQVAALAATGALAPRVLVAEPVAAGDTEERRDARVESLRAWFAAGIAAHPSLFAAQGWAGAARVPVARVGTVEGIRRRDGTVGIVRARELAFAELAHRLEAAPPALVHAHGLWPDGIAAASLARRLGVPFVITEHSTRLAEELEDATIRPLAVAACAAADAVVAVSPDLADRLAALVDLPRGRVQVIPNTVDVASFRAAPIEERTPDELLWVGNLKPEKGIEVLLRAFEQVRAARPAATLRLVGSAPSPAVDAEWRQLASQLGVTDAVRFDGPLDRVGVAAAMARASVFVHASRRETFGVVAAEALASGLPVVTTRTVVVDLLGADPAAVGAVVEIDDVDAFARATVDILARRGSFDPRDLRASVVDRVSGPAVAARLVALYEGVLGGRLAAARVAGGSAAPPRATAGASAAPAGTVVLAANPRRAESLALLPDVVLEGCRVIVPAAAVPAFTDRPLDIVPIPPVSGSLPARARRRLERALDRAWWPGAPHEAVARATLARVMRDATPERPLEIVPLDGADANLAAPFLASRRAVAVPASLAWLADRRAGQRREPPGGPA